MFKRNVKYVGTKRMTAWRKIAIGTWRSAGDPSIYSHVDIDARPILKVIEQYKQKGIKISPTVIMAKAVAYAIAKYPGINCMQRFGKLYKREDVDIFLQVAPDDSGDSLTGMVVRNCDQKELEDIASEIKTVSGKIKAGNDEDFEKVQSSMKLLPGLIVGKVMDILSFILYALNIWSPILGAPKDGFGSAMVTSVGMLGIEYAYAPLVPYSRCPLVIAIGAITEKPIVEDGKIIIAPMLPVNGTLDHRVIDGIGGGKMLQAIKEFCSTIAD